jgi:hypothetical protein
MKTVPAGAAPSTTQKNDLEKLLKNLKNLGKADAETLNKLAKNFQLTKEHLKSIASQGEDGLTGDQADELLKNIQKYHDTWSSYAPIGVYDKDEFERVKTFVNKSSGAGGSAGFFTNKLHT